VRWGEDFAGAEPGARGWKEEGERRAVAFYIGYNFNIAQAFSQA